jgi:hypothetical protein
MRQLQHFSPGSRKTITSEQTTQHTFDIKKLTALLDGDYADIIRRLKQLLLIRNLNMLIRVTLPLIAKRF